MRRAAAMPSRSRPLPQSLLLFLLLSPLPTMVHTCYGRGKDKPTEATTSQPTKQTRRYSSTTVPSTAAATETTTRVASTSAMTHKPTASPTGAMTTGETPMAAEAETFAMASSGDLPSEKNDLGAWWAWLLGGVVVAFALTASVVLVAGRYRGWTTTPATADATGESPRRASLEMAKLSLPPPYEPLVEPPPVYEEIVLDAPDKHIYNEAETIDAASRDSVPSATDAPAPVLLDQPSAQNGEVPAYAEPFVTDSGPPSSSNSSGAVLPYSSANRSKTVTFADSSLCDGKAPTEEEIYEEPPISPQKGEPATVFVDGVPVLLKSAGGAPTETSHGEFHRNSLYAESTMSLPPSETAPSAPAASAAPAAATHRNSMYDGCVRFSSEEDLYEPPPVYPGPAAGDEPLYESVDEAMANAFAPVDLAAPAAPASPGELAPMHETL